MVALYAICTMTSKAIKLPKTEINYVRDVMHNSEWHLQIFRISYNLVDDLRSE